MNNDEKELSDAFATLDESNIERVTPSALSVVTTSEVQCQVDTAHRYPRSITRFVKEAAGMATLSKEVAASCIYALPRDGKMLAGPSVRMAEICASAYTNLHAGTRVVDEDDKTITAQGVVWDVQNNVRITVETKRRITGKTGKRYSDDMVVMTGNAAASIALRNAIFRVIPRAYVDAIYSKVRKVAVGDAETLDQRRTETLGILTRMGVTPERLLARLGKRAVGDIGLEDLEVLIGLGTSIRQGSIQVDEAFPPVPATAPTPAPAPAPEQEGKRISLGKKKATVEQ